MFSYVQIVTQIGVALTSAYIGYKLGISRGTLVTRTTSKEDLEFTTPSGKDESESDVDDDESDEDEYIADGDLAAVKAGMVEQCKLVLLVRTDLKMTAGKISAQCGHATLACYKALVAKNPQLVRHWERTGQAKVALRVNSEDELLELEAIAKSLNLSGHMLPRGRTQVAEGSRTVLGIGPAPVNLINQVTGHLKLF